MKKVNAEIAGKENRCLKYRDESRAAQTAEILLLIALGAATGILSGFFGGGGGMVVVPALAAIMKICEKQAHATAIAVILPVTAVCAVVYGIRGISFGADFAPVAVGVVVGGLFGAAFMGKISNGFLSFIFYAVMIIAGIKMLL